MVRIQQELIDSGTLEDYVYDVDEDKANDSAYEHLLDLLSEYFIEFDELEENSIF